MCNKKWGPSVTLVSLQLRETSCAAHSEPHSAAQREHTSLFSYTRHSNNNALGIVHKYSSARTHTAWLKWELRDADDERHCSGCGNYLRPRNFEWSLRISCEGFKTESWKLLRWHLKSCLCRREKLRDVQIAQRGCKLWEWKGPGRLLKWKLKTLRKLTINTCNKRFAK